MVMIMSVQRLKESGGREEERERGVRQIFADKTAAPLRWLQEQIEAHTFSQSSGGKQRLQAVIADQGLERSIKIVCRKATILNAKRDLQSNHLDLWSNQTWPPCRGQLISKPMFSPGFNTGPIFGLYVSLMS